MVDKRIKNYELDLLYGKDIFIDEIKIKNYTLGEIANILLNESFYRLKIYLRDFKDKKDINRSVESNIDVLSFFLECSSVTYNEAMSSYCVYIFDKEGKMTVKLLDENAIETIFLLLKEMYWCKNAPQSTSRLIDESKAGDEKTLKAIQKWNQNQIQYNNKSESNITIFSAIERCASLRIGGYNFKTIQEITLYQLQCLIDSHTSDAIFRGYLSGFYSQCDMSKQDTSKIHWCNES